MHNELCFGIDLGTTNTVVAVINEKPNGEIISKVVDIPRATDMYDTSGNEAKLSTMRKSTLPSCIYYRQDKNYEPLVGDFAKKQYSLRPHLVAKSIKSQMGRSTVEGLSSDIPDKTPAEVSARILKHLLKEASKIYRCDITDAVITVPANFDPVMCKATRDAAELAGIKVKNADGSERPVLLSEPNAVIYDLINQIHNGEIPNSILDLNEMKRVLVFDLGGGTLDITMHQIKRRENNKDALKVDEIAINRYTRLGGDDFDEALAKEMYKRYLKQFSKYKHPDVMTKLRQDEKNIMAQLRIYAEGLKLDANETFGNEYTNYGSMWDDDEEDDKISVGGNVGSGYAYDDSFSKEEVEQILAPFMARHLNYNDYKRLDEITTTRNIIYPILDVLKKASDKLGSKDVKVDAVIVNGGMSKFYMITERLTQFFGFEPIVALDPDLAVARGAAVYHYYLHKYSEMQDDMKMIGNMTENTKTNSMVPILFGKNLLNESLYLGVKNGAIQQIIPAGAELPYTSSVMTGFKIEPGQRMIAIPIKRQKSNKTAKKYETIASGNILFRQHYKDGAYVAFTIHMASNKIITMEAWTSSDPEGKNKLEVGQAFISIEHPKKLDVKTKFVAPDGSILDPHSEINNLMQLCQNFEKAKKKHSKQPQQTLSKRIASLANNICNAGNKEDFAEGILEVLTTASSEEIKQRLFVIARRIGDYWNETQKHQLANVCMNQLISDINGFYKGGARNTTNIQAIYTLNMCGTEQQLDKLESLHHSPKYLQACLYTHAKTQTALTWLQEEFEKDIQFLLNGAPTNIQFSSHAIGIAFRKDTEKAICLPEVEEKIIEKLVLAIESSKLSSETLTCCLLALGWICDQRYTTKLKTPQLDKILTLIYNLEAYYPELIIKNQEKAKDIVIKMIQGIVLDNDEEQYLLTKLEQ